MQTLAKSFYMILFLCIPIADAAPFKVSKVLNTDEFSKLKKHTITVFDPNEKKEVTFVGYDGREFLDAAFGRAGWSKAKMLEFECADGYKPSLEAKDFANGGFYMAVERKDSKDFTITNNLKDGRKVAAGPYYIIWKDKKMQTKGKSHYWPYQLVGVTVQ